MSEDEDDIAACVREVLARRAAAKAMPGLTVRQLYDEYRTAHLTSKSWEAMQVKLAPFVATFGDRGVLTIEVLDWSRHAATRLATFIPGAKDGRFYCKRTVNAELGWAKALFSWAVGQGRVKYNPLAAAKRSKGVPKGRQTAPKEHEIGLLLAACRTPQQTVMVLSACDAGMRRGEILALRHDWVDYDAKTIALADYACKNGKGGVVPATQRLLDAIDLVPRHIRYPYVLWGTRSEKKNGKLSAPSLNSWWVEIRKRAGVKAAPGDKEVHLHDGRAAAGSNALARGVKLRTVSKKILRHANLATTEIYLRGEIDNDELASAVAAMEAGIVRDQEKRKPPRRANVDFSVQAIPEQTSGKSDG